MTEHCTKCGLPKELCVCTQMAAHDREIKIRLEKRSFGKDVTVLENFPDVVNLDDMASKLKKHCACGGTSKNGHVELQGNHYDKVYTKLTKMGFDVRWVERNKRRYTTY